MYKRIVLLPGDDQISANTLNEVLGKESYYVSSLKNQDFAVEMLKNGDADLIIMNPKYPKEMKLDLFKKIRRNYKKEVFPVIFLTPQPGKTSGSPVFNYYNQNFDQVNSNQILLASKVKKYFEKLEQIESNYQKKLDELRGNISLAIPHEFRTHLSGIVGFSKAITHLAEQKETLQNENLSEISEMANLILDSGNKLSRIAENFILYSQIRLTLDNPKEVVKLKQEKIDKTSEIIEEIIMTLSEKYDRKDDFVCDLREASINASWYHFYKCLFEIIDNALKFSNKGTKILVSSIVIDGNYELNVTDNGRGMTKEQLDCIGAYSQFERNKYEQQGAGLGLIIAKILCEIYDGKFNITSEPCLGTNVNLNFKTTTN